jgi:hypothetical protein
MTIYRIEITGNLDEHWDSWFEPLEITTGRDGNERPVTVLTGTVSDQSELRGLLAKIWDLNLELVSLKQIDQELLSGGKSHE